MRLPGLGLLNNETPPNPGSADAARDPAQAFDAVMSRFSNQGAPASAPKPNPDAPAKATNNAGCVQGKSPAAEGRHTQPGGKPFARAKAQDADDDSSDPAATDPAALMAVVAGSAQLAVQNPAPIAAVNAVAAAPLGKEAKNACPTATTALDVLAGQVNAAAPRAGEKIAAEPRSPIAGEDDVKPPGGGTAPGRRAPSTAKDTLRIDAPSARAPESSKADVAQRLSAAADAVVQATAHGPSAGSVQPTSQIIAAAVGGAANNADIYSIAHAAVAAPVGAPAFANELSQRVVVFAGQKVQRAEIAVTPAELGPITVSIEVRGQEATLAFAASSHATRAAIEDALPRLREMLSAQGLQLAGAHVGSEPRRDPYRPARRDSSAAGGDSVREPVGGAVAASSKTEIRRRVNLIDIEV